MNPPYPPVAQRESYTQQVSLKIGISLEKKFALLAHERNTHINNVFRDALVHYVAMPDAAQQPENLTLMSQRLSELEAQNEVLKQNAAPALSPAQIAYDAFSNEAVITAIRDIAERVENADIELTAEAILEQFVSFIPQPA